MRKSGNNASPSLGFTLVELVVVIMVLGILAAVSAPRLFDMGAVARDSSLRHTLAVTRDAIERYAADHNGTLPGVVADGTHAAGTGKSFRWQLRFFSRADGQVSKTDRAGYPLGPYFREFPKAPLGPQVGKGTIATESGGGPLVGDVAPIKAWKYNYATGEFILNYNGVSQDGGTTYDSF